MVVAVDKINAIKKAKKLWIEGITCFMNVTNDNAAVIQIHGTKTKALNSLLPAVNDLSLL